MLDICCGGLRLARLSRVLFQQPSQLLHFFGKNKKIVGYRFHKLNRFCSEFFARDDFRVVVSTEVATLTYRVGGVGQGLGKIYMIGQCPNELLQSAAWSH